MRREDSVLPTFFGWRYSVKRETDFMRPAASLYYTSLAGHNSVLETAKCSRFEQCIDLLLGEQKFALKEKKDFARLRTTEEWTWENILESGQNWKFGRGHKTLELCWIEPYLLEVMSETELGALLVPALLLPSSKQVFRKTEWFVTPKNRKVTLRDNIRADLSVVSRIWCHSNCRFSTRVGYYRLRINENMARVKTRKSTNKTRYLDTSTPTTRT